MQDINQVLRVAYMTALSGVGVPVYYQNAPDNLNPDVYIVFRSITNVDASTKSSSDLNVDITVEIHTKSNIGNTGVSADSLAGLVYQAIYSNKQTNIALSSGRVLQTRVVTDRTLDYTLKNQFGYIDRFITFNHLISIS